MTVMVRAVVMAEADRTTSVPTSRPSTAAAETKTTSFLRMALPSGVG